MPGLRLHWRRGPGPQIADGAGPGFSQFPTGLREPLFNLLGADIISAEVLDLFAGTGSVGIGGISRGASRAIFVESDRQAVNTIQSDLKTVGCAERGRVLRADVFIYSAQPAPRPASINSCGSASIS